MDGQHNIKFAVFLWIWCLKIFIGACTQITLNFKLNANKEIDARYRASAMMEVSTLLGQSDPKPNEQIPIYTAYENRRAKASKQCMLLPDIY
jgi:hypothetical protein